MANFDFVIDSSFKPFSFDEMLRPWVMYGNAYKEVEESYNDYMKKADTFKYLADVTVDDPRAKAIYEGYSNDLKAAAQDLAKNGLSIANRRSLTSLRQRYQGEIGQLERADEQLKEVLKGRNALAAAGKTMVYSNVNPRLSDFLGDGTGFNRYAIDAADLRTRGNALGKAMSSREYSNDEAGNILNNQYKIWRQTHGIKDIASFMQSDLVRQVVDNELRASGAADNLSGNNLSLARQNILNGIYEGIIYEESMKPLENGEYMSAKERASLAQSADATALNAALYGYKKNSAGQWVPDPTLQNVKGRSSSGSKSGSGKGGSGKDRFTLLNKGVKISWKGNNPNSLNGDADNDYIAEDLPTNDEIEHVGKVIRYDDLPQYAKDKVDTIIGPQGNPDLYKYYFQPYEGGFFNDTESSLEIIPYKTTIFNGEEEVDENDNSLE